MKVTQVSLKATGAAQEAGCPELTPELLAAVGARYSRNDEGLDAILAKVEGMDPEKAVDAIFRLLDYGHQSVADMVPVALFMDGVSIYMAYKLWALCPLAGGQETSTRYVKMEEGGALSADEAGLVPFGIPSSNPHALPFTRKYDEAVAEMFALYRDALDFWEAYAAENPEAVRIPDALKGDEKAVARIRRNYAFDRARYFLPVAAKTNVMMVQSAREWARLIMHLRSLPLAEARRLGDELEEALLLSAPRLARHCKANAALADQNEQEWQELRMLAHAPPAADVFASRREQVDRARQEGGGRFGDLTGVFSTRRRAYLEVSYPDVGRAVWEAALVRGLCHRQNRYTPPGSPVCRTQVRFSWESVSLAEIRDLNRHRTGTKYCPEVPVNFYAAEDQYEGPLFESDPLGDRLMGLADRGRALCAAALAMLRKGDRDYAYYLPLGVEFPFEHATTADKFLYEAQLRTGPGAHFRYARHLTDAAEEWFKQFPATRPYVPLGEGEPE